MCRDCIWAESTQPRVVENVSLKDAQSNEWGRWAARGRKGFLGRERAPLWMLLRFQPQVPNSLVPSLPRPGSEGSLGAVNTVCSSTGCVQGPVGGNEVAANVSRVRGNLCWRHGQGITSACSYRMYHLQGIPSTTHSKNQKKRIK